MRKISPFEKTVTEFLKRLLVLSAIFTFPTIPSLAPAHRTIRTKQNVKHLNKNVN